MEKKKILIPGGKTSDIALVNAAHRMGFYVITSGADTTAPAHKLADKFVPVDYSDKEALLRLAQDEKIDYMCSSANDIALVSTTYVCEKLGLPGYDSYQTTLDLHHKDRFKKVAEKLQLHVPKGKGFDNEEEALEYALSQDGTVVIKPVDMVGGNGVAIVSDPEEKRKAVKAAYNMSLCKHVVVEEYISGTSHSFSTYVVNKRVAFYYSDNEYAFAGPYRISTSGGPATDVAKIKDILIEDTEKVAEELDLVDGRVHLQYIMQDGMPYILEMSRRSSGDLYAVPESYSLGISTPDWIVRAACGQPCEDYNGELQQKGSFGRHCIVATRNGKVKKVTIAPELEAHIFDRMIWWEPGYEIKDWTKDSLGLLFYRFDTEEEMRNIVERVMDLIEVEFFEDELKD